VVLSFEFRRQPLDLLAASPLSNANLSDFGHADSASKTRAPARWGSSDGYEILTFDELFRKIGVLAKLFGDDGDSPLG